MEHVFYTEEEAKILINYYREKLIGQPIDESAKFMVVDVQSQIVNKSVNDLIPDNKVYLVMATASRDLLRFRSPIDKVASLNGLPSPEMVLKENMSE